MRFSKYDNNLCLTLDGCYSVERVLCTVLTDDSSVGSCMSDTECDTHRTLPARM